MNPIILYIVWILTVNKVSCQRCWTILLKLWTYQYIYVIKQMYHWKFHRVWIPSTYCLFRIFSNEANICSPASRVVGSTMIYLFCGFCLNARFLHIIALFLLQVLLLRHYVLLLPYLSLYIFIAYNTRNLIKNMYNGGFIAHNILCTASQDIGLSVKCKIPYVNCASSTLYINWCPKSLLR